MSFGMKWKINGFDDLNLTWPALIVLTLIIFVLTFCAYAFIWWLITLLLGISFAWNHAAAFYLFCAACGGFQSNFK